mmetsp:Transcript_5699/g.4850  ORF Transcript_5699/g.4850 Transcript_5699/m.4850 type:complete len:83 (+) Transcript_5699:493-741(+)
MEKINEVARSEEFEPKAMNPRHGAYEFRHPPANLSSTRKTANNISESIMTSNESIHKHSPHEHKDTMSDHSGRGSEKKDYKN